MGREQRKELDTIEVRVPRCERDFGYVRVNSRSFEDIVKASGGWNVARVPGWLVSGGKGALLDDFVGNAYDGASIHLFICSCGDWGCWGYSVSVRRTRRFVYWYNRGQRWFTFGRKLYEAAFANAAP